MIIALFLLSVAWSQETAAEQQVADLEKILEALERVHPEIVINLECEDALENGEEARPGLVACVRICAEEGADIDDDERLISSLRSRFPDLMAKQTDSYWAEVLGEARAQYKETSAE